MGKTPKTVRREPNGSGGQCMVGSCTLEAVGLREIAQIVFFLPSFTGLTARSAGAAKAVKTIKLIK